jgi:hypothetical protein
MICTRLATFHMYMIILQNCAGKVIQNHENKHVRSIGQGEDRYKRLKLGGGQAYDCSND